VEALKLSESNSYQLISVARKSRVIPELKVAVNSGQISVAKANRIVSGDRKFFCVNGGDFS
jgi:hypothetical protein